MVQVGIGFRSWEAGGRLDLEAGRVGPRGQKMGFPWFDPMIPRSFLMAIP